MRRAALAAGALVLAVVAAGCGQGPAPGTGAATVTTSPPAPQPAPAPRLTDAQVAGLRVVYPLPPGDPPPALLARIRRGEAGAVILFARNIPSPARARALIARLQAVPRPKGMDAPLLVLVDQEGGLVERVPDAALTSAAEVGTPARARAAGRLAATDARSIGANVDLAPVADVGRPGGVIASQRRSFSADPARAAAMSVAFARGLRDRGVIAVAKHFPGLGDAAETTDARRVTVTLPAATLRRVDGRPFAALVDDGVPAVMASSAVYPSLDSQPAMLSEKVLRVELRLRLGFDGLIVSDALDAPGATALGPPARTAVRAAAAGTDLLLYAGSYGAAESAARSLRQALVSGRLDPEVARESAARVLALSTGGAAGSG